MDHLNKYQEILPPGPTPPNPPEITNIVNIPSIVNKDLFILTYASETA